MGASIATGELSVSEQAENHGLQQQLQKLSTDND
jgi:hypothetical protein